MMTRLENLKKAIHPELTINIVEQAEIITQALEQETMGTAGDLAQYLEVSLNWVMKMKQAHESALPELKDYFRNSNFKMSTYHRQATESQEEQRAWLHGMEVLTSG